MGLKINGDKDFKTDRTLIMYEDTYEDSTGRRTVLTRFYEEGEELAIPRTLTKDGTVYSLRKITKYELNYTCRKVSERDID